MFYIIKSGNDKFLNYIHQDPIRPYIPLEQRLGLNRDIFMLVDDNKVKAITCVSYQQNIPSSEQDLFENKLAQVVVFYTIWSYESGSGRQLIFDCVKRIQKTRPNIKRFVTLSPKTEMAKKFHLSNGAVVYQENAETVNYEYLLATA